MTIIAPSPLTAQWTQRYLSLLGVEHGDPSLEALTRLIRAHVLAVPFENVTALLRRRDHPSGHVPPPAPATLLDTWERRAGGGVCFEICAMLVALLGALGYRAHLVLGHISVPNGHQAVLVEFDGERCLLDPGNGAPLFEPIALDGPAVEVHRHGLSYRFRHGEDANSLIQERMFEGAWATHCHYDLRPARPADREQGYQHHHTPNASWVTGTLTLVRSTPQAVFALRDDTLTRFTATGKSVETITAPEDFKRLATEAFGLSRLPIEEALDVRTQLATLARNSAHL